MFPPQSPTRMSVTPIFSDRRRMNAWGCTLALGEELWTHRIEVAFPFMTRPSKAEKSGKGLLRRSSAINRRCVKTGIAQNVDVEGHLLELPLHRMAGSISTKYFRAQPRKLCTLPPVIRP